MTKIKMKRIRVRSASNSSLVVSSSFIIALFSLDFSFIVAVHQFKSTKGIPIKKLLLVVDMTLTDGKVLHPARFAATLSEAGLLD